MTFFRRALGHVTLACLLSQLATAAVVPALLIAAAELLEECTCSHGDHAMCPMHHRTATGCGMRSAPDFAPALIPALLGCTGVMPHAATPVPALDAHSAFGWFADSTLLRLTPPDAPPPRG